MNGENFPRWDVFSDVKAKLSKFIGLCFYSDCLKSPKRAPVGRLPARLLLLPPDWFQSLRPSGTLHYKTSTAATAATHIKKQQ